MTFDLPIRENRMSVILPRQTIQALTPGITRGGRTFGYVYNLLCYLAYHFYVFGSICYDNVSCNVFFNTSEPSMLFEGCFNFYHSTCLLLQKIYRFTLLADLVLNLWMNTPSLMTWFGFYRYILSYTTHPKIKKYKFKRTSFS